MVLPPIQQRDALLKIDNYMHASSSSGVLDIPFLAEADSHL